MRENAGFFRKLRSLQKLMQRNYANLLLSVRRITQTNKGKATAGIDQVHRRVQAPNFNYGGKRQAVLTAVRLPFVSEYIA